MLCFLSPQISQIYTDFIVRHFGLGLNLRNLVRQAKPGFSNGLKSNHHVN